MDLIAVELSSPVFWVCTVFVALVVNLLSAYLKGPLDNLLSSTSVGWRNANNGRRRRWHEKIERIAGSQLEWDNERHLEIRRRLQAISYFLFAIMLLVSWDRTGSETMNIFFNGFLTTLGIGVGSTWVAANGNSDALEDVVRFRRGQPLSIRPPDVQTE